jgi:hypothetical protein
MSFTNLEKPNMVLIYGEARGHSELARQIYGERFLQRTLWQCTNLYKRCAASSRFRAFEMKKRQRGGRILVVEEEILTTNARRLANHLRVSQFVVWLPVQNAAQEIHQNPSTIKTEAF